MEVSNPRSALLSDYEVLRLLRDVEQQQKNQQEQQQQQPLGTTTPASLDRSDEWMRAIPENLRTVQFEVSWSTTR